MSAALWDGVCKGHAGAGRALDGFSLEAPEGRITVLLGTSGAGKTTALKLLNRMLDADAGRVVVLGRDAREWNPVELRRRVGWVIQEAGLLPHLSVLENAGLVPRILGWDVKRGLHRARESLALVGLPPERFGERTPAQLSGGERQRVGLARALCAQPELLLMDEPFGALDPVTRLHLQREFRALQRRLGTTVVLVTHDLPEALRIADVVAVVDQGRVLQSGTPEEIRERPAEGRVSDLVAAALTTQPA